MKIRRVVTGHDDRGRAVVVSDEPVDGFAYAGGEGAFHVLWGADAPPRFPDGGAPATWSGAFPPVGGFRFLFFTLPPGGSGRTSDEDLQSFLAGDEAGLSSYMKEGDPGMHRTPTIDFEVVLSGEVGLELDDGREVRLHPNDVVVQNGTMHRWHNRGDTPATMAVVVVGARHDAFSTEP